MTQVEELLQSARSAVDAGNQLVARGYLRRASRLAPERLDIWQALLKVTERPEDRLRCLEQIVQLAPDDAEAASDLNQVQAELEAAQAQELAQEYAREQTEQGAGSTIPTLQDVQPNPAASPSGSSLGVRITAFRHALQDRMSQTESTNNRGTIIGLVSRRAFFRHFL